MVYKWSFSAPARYREYDPQIVGEHLFDLQRRTGGPVTADAVVTDARNVESPLHDLFVWDDTRASILFRKNQAREIARSLIVVRSNNQLATRPLTVTTRPVLAPAKHKSLISGEVHHRRRVERGLAELRRWYERNEHLKELEDIIEAIDRSWPDWAPPLTVRAKALAASR